MTKRISKNSIVYVNNITELDIISKFKETDSINETAVFYKCSVDTISKILKKNDVKNKRKQAQEILETNKEDIIQKYADGFFIKELSAAYPVVSPSGMLHALKRWGVKIRLAWDSRKFKINYANLTCKGCSKLFVRPPNLANALFCKDDCRREYESMHGTPLRKEKTKSNCAFCKKDLYLLPSKKRKTNFCNRTCKIAYTKSGQLPKTQKTVEIICLTCKKPKIIPQKTFERYETKYCSRNCYAKCGPTRTSKPHLAVRHFLEKYGIIFQEEVSVGDYWMDFTTNNKICIEVNGDYWHCNPKKYKSDYLNRKTKKTAAEIWEKDKERKEFIEKSGYKVIILWESDIMKNINSILETTLKEIMLHLNIEICANSIKEKIDKSHKSCNSKQEILN